MDLESPTHSKGMSSRPQGHIRGASLNPGDICAAFGLPQEVPCDELSLLKTTVSEDKDLEALVCAAKGAWLRGAVGPRYWAVISRSNIREHTGRRSDVIV